MDKPNRTDEKYWDGARFRNLIYEEALEEYIDLPLKDRTFSYAYFISLALGIAIGFLIGLLWNLNNNCA